MSDALREAAGPAPSLAMLVLLPRRLSGREGPCKRKAQTACARPASRSMMLGPTALDDC